MSDSDNKPIPERTLAQLRRAFHAGSSNATKALTVWIEKFAVVETHTLDQMSIQDATSVLGSDGAPVCFCSVQLTGQIEGEMILAFDDESGFTLADVLLGHPRGTTNQWAELEKSAVMETANIVCCAYLSSLCDHVSDDDEVLDFVAAPPLFSHEFPESLMQFALMSQTMVGNQVIFGETRFQIDGVPINCTLLFIPSADSMARLGQRLLPGQKEH